MNRRVALPLIAAAIPVYTRPMVKWVLHSASLGFSLLCYAMVLVIGGPANQGLSLDAMINSGLAGLSLLSLALVLFQSRPLAAFGIIGLKIAISLLVGIPWEVGDGREELLYYAVFADCLLFLPGTWGIVVGGLTLLATVGSQHAWKTWDVTVPAAPTSALAAYGVRLGLVLVLASGIRIAFVAYQRKYSQWKHLENSIQAIVEANLQLQGYAVQVERDSTETERKRITREIHDIIGYSLANQLMVLEAGILLADSNPKALKPTLIEARTHLQDGLEDIRREIRALRETENGGRTSLSELFSMCHIFQESTGVQVHLELAMQTVQLEPALFHCLYRIIQQGLTNSFFHGRASLVEVCLIEQQGILHMTIIDNGGGSLAKPDETLQDGIGLAGMAERLESFAGHLSYVVNPNGFQLNVTVPLGSPEGNDE